MKPVACALLYTKYNVMLRFLMKRIAGKPGGSSDATRDQVDTDWEALDRFVNEFAGEISRADDKVVQ